MISMSYLENSVKSCLVPNSCLISVDERWRTAAVVPVGRLALSLDRPPLYVKVRES
jgi:hypothetical protein